MKLKIKNAVIKGTLILTAAGFLSRIIGFFYRIFLTRAIGAEGMGLFQLVTPIIGVVFAVCSAGIQTGISKFCAVRESRRGWLLAGLIISLPLSLLTAVLVYMNAGWIAGRILLNPTCAPLIQMLALTFPFASFHNCVNGYYYGQKKTGIPAFSQLFEQLVRVMTVIAYAAWCEQNHRPVTVICALYGNLTGEIASAVFCTAALLLGRHLSVSGMSGVFKKVRQLFIFSFPLTANRLLMHLLQSGESILIPAQLAVYGHSSTEALSLYGILNGMALPLILFPTAITNAMSVMLLPEVSGAQAANRQDSILRTLDNAVKLCMAMGIMSTLLFIFYGSRIGALIFDEPAVHSFILILAWLCPFFYLTTTLNSILNGLGKTTLTCVQNIFSILIRIAFLIVLVPVYGISAYLCGLLVSQIFICLAHYISLSNMFRLKMDPVGYIIMPSLYSGISIGVSLVLFSVCCRFEWPSELARLVICACCACLVFLLLIRNSASRHA